MPSKRSKWNPDPSRGPGTGAHGTGAADLDDRAVLLDFADAGDWQRGVVADVPGSGRPDCNSAAHDHIEGTKRTTPGIHRHNKTAAAGPTRRVPPCIFAGGDGQRQQLRGRLGPA